MLHTRAALRCAVLALSLGATTVSLVPAAFASAAHPQAASADNGRFSTWSAAQTAAGFGLKKPTVLHGLHQAGKIQVTISDCDNKPTKHDVIVGYGKFSTGFLTLEQNNSGDTCGDVGDATLLATPKIDGVKAHLYSACGQSGQPPCSSKRATFFLVWKKGKIAFAAESEHEPRSAIISFGRSLKPVG